jgi:zinc and cadmium transporter
VVDGVVLVTAFAASSTLGLAAAISILIHEVLQEISEFFVLRQAGYSVRKALSINLAVSSTVLIGVVLGYFALVSKELEIILLAISAGFFLHVVIHDLLPKPDRHNNATQFFKHLALFVLGALLMGSIAITLGGGHA